MSEHDVTFPAMGGEVRLLIGRPAAPGLADPARAADEARCWIERFEAVASRFDPDSELCRLNADTRSTVPVSPLLATAVAAGLWAARRSGGLVDPTLLSPLEAAGYARSRAGQEPASLADALAAAPPRRPARPQPARAWSRVRVDAAGGLVRRPAGVRLDTGGTGKGLAADALAHRLRGYRRFMVDCGGDLRVGGVGIAETPYDVEVQHPLTGEHAHVLRLDGGGVATSGLDVRLWRADGGGFAHHLLDPSTGEPAWTGLIGVTALGASTLEAETLSKLALLSGPERARGALAEHGGLLVHDSGDVELVGPLRGRPRLRVRAADLQAGAAAA